MRSRAARDDAHGLSHLKRETKWLSRHDQLSSTSSAISSTRAHFLKGLKRCRRRSATRDEGEGGEARERDEQQIEVLGKAFESIASSRAEKCDAGSASRKSTIPSSRMKALEGDDRGVRPRLGPSDRALRDAGYRSAIAIAKSSATTNARSSREESRQEVAMATSSSRTR